MKIITSILAVITLLIIIFALNFRSSRVNHVDTIVFDTLHSKLPPIK